MTQRAELEAEGWGRVTRLRMHELVIDRIEEQIAAGRLKVGDRLPAERELAATLGVGRAAVREAMRVLEAMGTMVQGTGSGPEAGTILTAAPADALARFVRLHVLLASIGSQDVVRARVALERESTRLAALHAGPADFEQVSAALEAMDDPDVGVEEFTEQDIAFHVSIAQSTGNLLVSELTTALRIAMRPALLESLRTAPDFEAVVARLRAEHHAIYDAIVDGDGLRAAELVESHIDGFYHRT